MKKDVEELAFVTIEQGSPRADVLRHQSKALSFPLSQEDKRDIEILKAKFQATENCAGLAAPQIGIAKQIIIYHVDEIAKQWRTDIHDIVEPRVLINPTYRPLNEDKKIDWEGCFSVESQYGEVPRFISIEYEAHDEDGNVIKNTASGFHARILQHEIGHLNKELFIDLFTKDCRHGDFEYMRAIRMKELEEIGKKPK